MAAAAWPDPEIPGAEVLFFRQLLWLVILISFFPARLLLSSSPPLLLTSSRRSPIASRRPGCAGKNNASLPLLAGMAQPLPYSKPPAQKYRK